MSWGLKHNAPSAGDYRTVWTHGPRIVFIVCFFGFLFTFGGFQIRKYFATREEALRRDVVEESKSYRDGTIRDLDNLRLQWLAAEPGVHRDAIAATARHRSADFPDKDLPERLRDWLKEVR